MDNACGQIKAGAMLVFCSHPLPAGLGTSPDAQQDLNGCVCGKAAAYPQEQLCRTSAFSVSEFVVQESFKPNTSFFPQLNGVVSC